MKNNKRNVSLTFRFGEKERVCERERERERERLMYHCQGRIEKYFLVFFICRGISIHFITRNQVYDRIRVISLDMCVGIYSHPTAV